jgi:Reverse transcriptase (RNA-dependent DNA polymerase)
LTYISLVPTIECLADETVLIQAWKKTASYIRYHNWFSDTLELDRTAINLREFIAKISAEIKSDGPLLSDPIRMVPAPKSQRWRIESDGQWKPVDGNGDTAKIRPLAHVSLRDQVIATAMMMCLADRVETRQGDPATPLGSAELHSVVSYGNRLFSDFKNGKANQRWGSGTLYRGFYEDYQTFLARPEDIAEKIHKDHPRTLIVQSDLRQFYDRVTAELLHNAIGSLQDDVGEGAFFELATGFLTWKWSDKDRKEVKIYAKQSGIPDFSRIVLPQGLAAAGFFANVALTTFDKQLRDQIGREILPNIKLHDVARYVDDLRFVLSAPLAVDIEAARSDIFKWIKDCLDRSALGLSPAKEKTQVSAFRADERPLVQQSRRMARIQAAISGGFDPVAGGEILDSVLALVRAQDRLARAEAVDEHDPFRPVPDVRDSTVDRFVAGRFRSTYRSLRPQLWQTRDDQKAEGDGEEYSQFRGVRTRSELDDEMRAFALELISKWVSDPSNVRLLRIALDLWPDADVLTRILNLLRRFTQKGGPRNAPRRIAWYCLSEILRAGAVETGFVEDDEQLPSAVKVDEYRRVLREEALRIVRTTETLLPWYLKQQAYLLLATEPPDIHALPSHGKGDLWPYARLLQFLKGDARKWLPDEFATYSVLARRSYLDSPRAVDLVGQQLTPSRLNRIASLDPNFAAELVEATGEVSALAPRVKADLGLADHSDAKSSTLAKIVLSPGTRNMLRNERALLSFASKFLLAIHGVAGAVAISPSEVTLNLDSEMLEVGTLQLHPRNLAGDSLYDAPSWVPADDHWRFQLGFLLRFILTAQSDFTRPARRPHWKEEKQIYRPPGGHWHERIHGFFNGHSAFGDDWLPISDWVEKLLFGLLWWPGCAGQRADTPVVGTLSDAQEAINARLKYMREMQGSSVALLPLKVPGAFKRHGKPLRACVVQMAFPSEGDFREDDLSMSAGALRIRHRRHLSAALAAVKSALALRETHKGMDQRLDWLILPELAVHPDDVRTHLIPFARAHKTIILAGLTYEELFRGQPMVNSAIWVLPTHHPTRGAQILTRRQGKKHLAPIEKEYETKGLVQSFRPCQWLIGYDWSNDTDADPLWLTAAICFDATDLRLAADLKDRSDIFAIPALNKDVKTFDNMALALHYHMHQMVVVANNGNYGGSNAYAPYTLDWKRQIFHMHGQPQASIAFFELDNVAAFKNRKASGGDFKPPPAG